MTVLSSQQDNYAKVARQQISEHVSDRTDSRCRPPRRKQDWRAPIVMLSTFFAGLGVALAQHFTYNALDMKPVLSLSVSQAWISRIGTGLAFLVKLFLTICVGAAFVQHQWMQFHDKSFRVGEIDTVTSALANIFYLFKSTVLYRHPALLLMALASW